MRMRIGFVGLGTMGEPIANNLRKAGHELTVWNRTAAKASHIVSKGGKLAATARECASGKDLVFTCVADEAALEAVLGGPEGVLAGMAEGGLLIDLSTVGTRATRAVQERAAKQGVRFICCPIIGSKTAAEQAQVTLVAGGPGPAREKARPALHAVSARLFELDEPVQAALMKLCINAIGGAMMTSFGEALALGAAGGLDVWRMIEVLQASSYHSPLFLMKGEQVEKRDFAPRFKLSLAEKDQRLAQEAAQDLGSRLPICEAVRKVMGETAASGRGDKDVSAVAEVCLEAVKR
jgi:3-hydroxyisobutyrate dehydrogenase-like beta-hydroxyacid dehydrogenase